MRQDIFAKYMAQVAALVLNYESHAEHLLSAYDYVLGPAPGL